MKTSPAGLALIRMFEGCELTSYRCAAGVWTIGYGHTGPDVEPRMNITKAQADALLERDIERFEQAVTKLTGDKAMQGQFDALVSFAFNLGPDALRRSTLLRLHNAGDYKAAAAEFGKWTLAAGKRLKGHVRRREAEAELYRSGR